MQFHDATLVDVVIDWPAGTTVVRLRVAGSDAPVEVIASGVVDVSVTRRQPWGPSGSVNMLRVAGGTLSIETQSGDVIVISAAAIRLPGG